MHPYAATGLLKQQLKALGEDESKGKKLHAFGIHLASEAAIRRAFLPDDLSLAGQKLFLEAILGVLVYPDSAILSKAKDNLGKFVDSIASIVVLSQGRAVLAPPQMREVGMRSKVTLSKVKGKESLQKL